MKTKKNIISELDVFESKNDLNQNESKLFDCAAFALENAHAPYSNFKVGAAVQLENGEIISASNQENAAYPSGLCAERVALFYASSQHPNKTITSIFVLAKNSNNQIVYNVSPCGGCRQAIAEYEHKQSVGIKIYFMAEAGEIYCTKSINDLLPLCFSGKSLE